MEQVEVSIVFIRQGDTYLLQRRPNIDNIGAAGLIGAFGGRVERGESAVEAVSRELSEETSLELSTDNFNYLGIVEVVAYRQHLPMKVTANVFETTLQPDMVVTAKEGDLVRLTRREAKNRSSQLTPATRTAFERLIKE